MATGTVKCFDAEKGFGFIAPKRRFNGYVCPLHGQRQRILCPGGEPKGPV